MRVGDGVLRCSQSDHGYQPHFIFAEAEFFRNDLVPKLKLDFTKEALMAEREEQAEIVKSGSWLYDGVIPSEVWIVKQTFEYHYEADYSDEPERLNQNGECFSVVIARNGKKIGRGSEEMSFAEAVSAAERVTPGLVWDDHLIQPLYGGRRHSRTPIPEAD